MPARPLRINAEEHGTDVAAYTAGKRAFVARVLATVGIQPGRR